jgi:hypothetical protein
MLARFYKARGERMLDCLSAAQPLSLVLLGGSPKARE